MASLPATLPPEPSMVIEPDEALPTVATSITTPSLLPTPLVPAVPVMLMAPPAEYTELPETKTTPRMPSAVFTPPVPVRVTVPAPPAETLAELVKATPWLYVPVPAPPP